MTTLTRHDRWAGESVLQTHPLDRLLGLRVRVPWDVAAVAALCALAVAFRFYVLGDRAIHHDESLHATFAWYFYKGMGYTHDPLMHGPFLFHSMALIYGLFGLTDTTARFVPALLGSVLVALPLLLRQRLGHVGTVAAASFIAISPTLLYFSRFVGAGAQDIVLAVTALVIVAACWRYLDDGRSSWLYAIAGALAVSFATKEVTFIIALVLLLWLNGLMCVELAAQREHRPARRLAATILLYPTAWLILLLWPAIGDLRARLRFVRFTRSADLLMLLGVLTVPQFAAAVQVPLERAGFAMDAPSRIGGITNEALFGGASVGLLVAASVVAGLVWRRRDFMICAAIFWGIYIVLFTTFFTNIEGFASGIWGSLDYWIAQHGEERGKQPVFYYAVLTPVYEYMTLVLALWGIGWAAVRGGVWSVLALIVAVALLFAAVAFGGGTTRAAPAAAPAILALLLALRRDLFRSFLAFWGTAMFFALSVAGEKMPWLEVHIALPLTLLAAVTVNDVVVCARQALSGPGQSRHKRIRRPVMPVLLVVAPLAGTTIAVQLLWPGDAGERLPMLTLLALAALVAVALAALTSRRFAPLAFGLALLAVLLPLTVRDGVRAAFVYADTPHDLLIYTQTSPRLKEIAGRIDQLARESGQGANMPIMIDASDAFTWPWAWYLRDYKNVTYVDLSAFPPAELAKMRPGAVLITQLNHAGSAETWPGQYGPGERFPHRWWFPEETYRSTTAPRLWQWIQRRASWAAWADFFLDRTTPYPIGSIDAVAFFPPDFVPAHRVSVPTSARPHLDGDQLIVGNEGTGNGQFSRPSGLALDSVGNVLVVDSGNNRLQSLSPTGRFIATSPATLGLRDPKAVATDSDGSIYVADTWNDRVVKLNSALKLVTTWGGPAAASRTDPGPMELFGPQGIAVDSLGNVWVADTGHDRLVAYDPSGRPLGVFGSAGSLPGQFNKPAALALAPNGDLLVADAGNARVQRFDPFFAVVSQFQLAEWENLPDDTLVQIAVLPDGSVLASVPSQGELVRVGEDGRGRATYGDFGSASGSVRPVGITVDQRGRPWIADGSGSHVIRLPVP